MPLITDLERSASPCIVCRGPHPANHCPKRCGGCYMWSGLMDENECKCNVNDIDTTPDTHESKNQWCSICNSDTHDLTECHCKCTSKLCKNTSVHHYKTCKNRKLRATSKGKTHCKNGSNCRGATTWCKYMHSM
jgi:hypothetical protein